MAKHITQKVVFKNTKPKAVFDLYMNPKLHALISGTPVKISSKSGSAFLAYGSLTGVMIQTIKDKLITQTWRDGSWDASDPDSVFTILLEPKGKDTVLYAIHANLPDAYADDINQGWHDYYWTPWKQHLSGKKIKRQEM